MDDDREERVNRAAAEHDIPAADPSWIEPLYREHSADVLRAAYRITGSREDAEDVVHTVFLRLARRTAPPELGSGASSYLRRAATNAALDIVTSKRRRTTGSLTEIGEAITPDDEPSPERRHHASELADALRRSLGRIHRRGAEMFVLRYLEDLDNGAIAEIFDTTPGSVAVTLHRVRATLRDELSSLLGGLS
jgi:RNA polymerase sigma-70 factor (ECF subfamily)